MSTLRALDFIFLAGDRSELGGSWPGGFLPKNEKIATLILTLNKIKNDFCLKERASKHKAL